MFDRLLPASLLLLTACAANAEAQPSAAADSESQSSGIVRFSDECEKWDDWNKPARPFQINANTYYVGTCGIAAILIMGDAGHVLIDTGTRKGAEVVLSNIRALGIRPDDIDLLLHSHEHFDHVGGMAFMHRETGAQLVASKPGAAVLFSGQSDPRDPQYGMHEAMETVMPERHIENGESEKLGDITVTAIETPGHSPGALSWQWQSCDGDGCKTIVYADSLSPISGDDYRFSDHPRYVAQYRAGLERIAAIDCDILLTPHPSHSRMIERAATGTLDGGMTCQDYSTGKMRDLDARLDREMGPETGGTQ